MVATITLVAPGAEKKGGLTIHFAYALWPSANPLRAHIRNADDVIKTCSEDIFSVFLNRFDGCANGEGGNGY